MSGKQKRLVLIEKEEKMDTRIQGNFIWRLEKCEHLRYTNGTI